MLSPYITFNRQEWAALRENTPLTLSETDLKELQGLNGEVSMQEVIDIFVPLSRLLSLYVTKSQDLFRVTDWFLQKPDKKFPL